MIMYALEGRHRRFVLAFAVGCVVGCVVSAVYGFLAGAWPFGVVELIWAVVALPRWDQDRRPLLMSTGGPVRVDIPPGHSHAIPSPSRSSAAR
jgi:hypothetical protein